MAAGLAASMRTPLDGVRVVMEFTVGNGLRGGKYVICRVLEQAHLGVMLEAKGGQSRPVIIQTLNPKLRTTETYSLMQQQFKGQIQRFSQCQHPALVQLIEAFEEYDLPFAVLDRTVGRSLVEVVRANGVLPIQVALRIMQQVGSALDVLHRHGLIHQTVSPHHIMQPVGADIAVLVNVRLFAALRVEGGGRSRSALMPEYAAIEQYQPHIALTPQTDLYALAGTLYFLLTGYPPVSAPMRSQTAIVPPRQLNPQITATLEAAMLQGLAMNPQARPTTLSEWLSGLMVAAPAAAPHSSPAARSVNVAPAQPPVAHSAPQPDEPVAASAAKPPKSLNPLSPNPLQPMISVPSKRFSGAVFTTTAIAVAIGIGTGLALRLAATTTGSGPSFFHSIQSFPEIENWPGESLPIQPPPVAPAPLPPVRSTYSEPVPMQPVEAAPEVPPPASEVMPPLPEEAPIVPSPPPAPAVIEPAVPPPAAAPNAIAPEPNPVAPPPLPEPAPPPPVSQPAPPPVSN